MVSYLVRDAYGLEENFDIVDEDFMVAFTLEDYDTQETKMDTRYVKYYALYSNMTNGNRTMTEVPLHYCTEEDFERFYPVESRSAGLLNKYKHKPAM